MEKRSPDLEKGQWRFLAALEALGGPAHIRALDVLAPLTAGQLMDLMRKTADAGIIRQEKGERFSLGTDLPQGVTRKIQGLNTRKALSALADAILSKNLESEIGAPALIRLFESSGRPVEAGRLECELGDRELEKGNPGTAQKIYMSAVTRLKKLDLEEEDGSLFVSRALRLAHLCFVLGRDIGELGELLNRAKDLAKKMGDKRSHALINLYIGQLYYFANRRDEAFAALTIGLNEVNELGDDDIIAQSAEFIALLYFMKGQFKDAMKHLELVENIIGINEVTTLPITYTLFSYTSLYLGQFHRAIGFLDNNLRLAEETSNKGLASVLRSILGTTLILVKKYHEAEIHLKKARQEALEGNNVFGYHYSGGGLALLSLMKGDIEKSYRIMCDTVERASRVGLIQQFSSPWILEIFYEFDRAGLKTIQNLDYSNTMEMILNGTNVHLRGVALRLRAQQKMDQESIDRESILKDLEGSRSCLELSGNRMQLAKTVLETAHLDLLNNDRDAASRHAQEAWRLLGGYAPDFFPDQYKGLLGKKQSGRDQRYAREDFLKEYFEEMNSIKSGMRQEETLNKTIISTNRFFGAERGALFWFADGKFTRKPELRASSNLTKEEVESQQFRPYMEHVLRAFRTNKPLVVRNDPRENELPDAKIRSVLCIPLEVQGMTRGVLYHDNSYLRDAFDYLDPSTMALLSRHTSDMVDFLLDNMRMREEKEKLSREKHTSRQEFKSCRLISGSRAMGEQISMADQAAATDTTVLILGETGTGKGLFARWVHEKSPRSEGPFIVVDCTTIPENLFESELFGYEKGAFTGADRQKLGRVEMAHEGTLFLDEIGELPLHVQTKLLKTLEEKTFVRIGGGRPIRSDFRLIVATNRNLKSEVAAGRFREDLYYRLHVFPISIPPLRERDKDIAGLARHFIELYAREYGRPNLTLSKKDESMLLRYSWPGNVRELQNVIERAVILSKGDGLQIPLFPSEPGPGMSGLFNEMPTLDELQRRYIRHILDYTRGRISGPGGAAEILGLKRTAIYSRMKALGMEK